MPKTALPLTDTRIRALKPKATLYAVSDGGGLVLHISTTGAKIWRFRFSLHGKQQPLVTIGPYPATGLMVARERARRYAEIVAGGVSPVADAQRDRGAAKNLSTVREFGVYWMEQEINKKSSEYKSMTARALDKDIYPAIGNKSLADVNPGDVLAICDRIKNRGAPMMALESHKIVKRLFDYAIARHLAVTNPATAVVARYIATKKSRDRVLTPDEIGVLLRAVDKSDLRRALKLALHLLVMTMVRKSELIEARWSEFDWEAGIWRIPAERMKKDRDHWVYLAPQVLAMLMELYERRTSEVYVFPSTRGRADRPIAKNTLNMAVWSLGLPDVEHFVLHDFRRTASTHLNEMGYSPDAIEKALAHEQRGVRAVYNRAQYAKQRQELLTVWAAFVEAQIEGGRKVVVGKFGGGA